jgi:hypothetical protein
MGIYVYDPYRVQFSESNKILFLNEAI